MGPMSQEKMRRIGARVLARRTALGLSRGAFEEKSGIAAQALQDLEVGRYQDIQLFRLMPMLAALGLRLDDVSRGLDAKYDDVLDDHSRHGADGRMSASQEAADVFPATQARIRELEAENARLRAKVDADELTLNGMRQLLAARTGEANEAPKAPASKHRRRRRGHG